jgi:hypothetical protein
VLLKWAKKEVKVEILKILNKIPDAKIKYTLNSKTLQIQIIRKQIKIQVEVQVALECPSDSISTGALARRTGELPRIIRVISYDVALAHKLAAWNERRLIRDLYDVYFFISRVGVEPHMKHLNFDSKI